MLKLLLGYGSKWFTIILIPFLIVFYPVQKAVSAEKVIVRYGNHRMSIDVEDLTTFVQTGEQSPTLKTYFRFSEQNPQLLRNTLGQNIPVNGVHLSKTLNSPFGMFLLNPLSEVIFTPSHSASKESLRGALVISALNNNNQLNLIDVLKNYPTNEVHIQGDRIMKTHNMIQEILNKIPFLSSFNKNF